MTKTYIGAFPVIRIKTNESVCFHVPDILCKAVEDCNSCPFEDSKKHAGVMLIIERESTDNEKN